MRGGITIRAKARDEAMDNTTYIALSRQQSLWNQLEVVANNLANVNTTGFKGSDTLFAQYLFKSKSEDRTFTDRVAFTHDFGLVRNLSQGALNYTGNTFDVSLQGAGYFVVQKADSGNGQTPPEAHYTRAGSFTLNNSGQLVTQTGELVMSTTNQPIQIPNDGSSITIQGDGTIISSGNISPTTTSVAQTTPRTIGKLRIVTFDNERDLKAVDGTKFAASAGQQPVEDPTPKVAQGVLEDSNVNAISEMTRLININRSYADIAKLIDEEHTRIRQTSDTFTKQVSA
ncbi:MAG: flagellar hook-basal body complex protein [Rhodospirillaceae bacterium]|nr:MAG: flagellar hook-basal body complex protein [Rhodospirillaceae bacterium]